MSYFKAAMTSYSHDAVADSHTNWSTTGDASLSTVEQIVEQARDSRRLLDCQAKIAAKATVCSVCNRRMRFSVDLQELQVCPHVEDALRARAALNHNPALRPFETIYGIRVVCVPPSTLPEGSDA